MSEDFEKRVLRNTVFLIARADGVNNELIQDLVRVRFYIEKRITDAPDFQSRFRAKQIAAELEKTLSALYTRWGYLLTDETRHAVNAVSSNESALFSKSFSVQPDDFYSLPVATLDNLVSKPIGGKTLSSWASTWSASQSKVVKRVLFEAITEGLGAADAAKKLRESGALSFGRAQSSTVARTVMLQAANGAREDMLETHKTYIKAYRYVATLDSRTCLICSPYDGRTRKTRSELPNLLRHLSCRCTVLPWDKELVAPTDTRPAVLHDSSVVRHQDGSTETKRKVREVEQVGITTTYQQWFDSLAPSEKLQILGRGRYDLYAKGSLTLKAFATPQRIKSIHELKKAIGSD